MKATGKVAALLLLSFFVAPGSALALVNINTASLAELDTLPGVGPATAQNIIDARPYATKEEISKADGIGEPGSSSYDNIIDLITVSGGSQDTQEEEEEDSEQTEAEQTDEEDDSNGSSSRPKTPAAKVVLAAPGAVVAGAPARFAAQAYDENGKTLSFGVRYEWNFGDGTVGSEQEPLHTYAFAGAYQVRVAVRYRGKELVARHEVVAVAPTITVSAQSDGSVVLANKTGAEIDVGHWSVVDAGKEFYLPANTYVGAGASLRLPATTLGFAASNSAQLRMPGGVVVPAAAPAQKPVTRAGAPIAKAAAPAVAPEEALVAATAAAPAAKGVLPLLPYAGLVAVLAAGMAGAYYARVPQGVTKPAPEEFDIE